MKRTIHLCMMFTLTLVSSVHAWKSSEPKGEQPIFVGTLITQEGNSFNVTNIVIGKNRTSHEKIMLYEKPKNLKPSEKGTILTVNPFSDLTTSVLELQKIKKIEVPAPQTIWKWTSQDSKRSVKTTYEYIEILVTWRSGSLAPYLLELGIENSRQPVKIFCDVIDKKMRGSRHEGVRLCQKVQGINLHKKGAPFSAVESLTLDEPCYKIHGKDEDVTESQNDK